MQRHSFLLERKRYSRAEAFVLALSLGPFSFAGTCLRGNLRYGRAKAFVFALFMLESKVF